VLDRRNNLGGFLSAIPLRARLSPCLGDRLLDETGLDTGLARHTVDVFVACDGVGMKCDHRCGRFDSPRSRLWFVQVELRKLSIDTNLQQRKRRCHGRCKRIDASCSNDVCRVLALGENSHA